MSVSVCLSVCVCFSFCDHIYGTTRPMFTNFLCVLLTYGRGSVFIWRRNDMLCTSGFMGFFSFAEAA